MDFNEFRKTGHAVIDWMADYMEGLSTYAVSPNIKPGGIKQKLPKSAPIEGEPFEDVFKDFKNIIVPGMTHWQHPRFFAYFPSGSSPASILADMLSSALSPQCMMWLTSPAAEELEERMMEWLRDILGLPDTYSGVIHDTSSTANLITILMAREFHSSYAINQRGFSGKEKYRIYVSSQTHSSIEKGAKIAGLGANNVVKVGTDENFEMQPNMLEEAIERDIAMGYIPLCVISTMGSTNSTAIDPIEPIGKICKKYQAWYHVDASYAGTALILPEMRWMSKGIHLVDSFVVNPHKWMFTNLDCSAYFVKDKQALIKTFMLTPSYLKTPYDAKVNNYKDWGIALGRRFRSLKLWFVMRTYGVEGLQKKLREHIEMGQWVKKQVEDAPNFELMAPVPLNLVCFRYKPKGVSDEEQLNTINHRLCQTLNKSGEIFLTQTQLNDKTVIRFVSGNHNASIKEVKQGWDIINKYATTIAYSTDQ